MFSRATLVFFGSLSVFLLVACGDDTAAEKPTCEALGELCHDSTTEAGIDCHETAEDAATTEDMCLEMEAACRAECE